MTKITRSNRPELRGPLPAPTRPCGGKRATGPSRKPSNDNISAQGGDYSYLREVEEGQKQPSSEYGERDELDSESSEVTQIRPSTPEIRILSKEEQIKLRVKEHVALWRKCQIATREGATPKLRALLTEAQESQKTLQKLIDNEEIESYVKGWNPWDEKKIHFPAPPKKQVMKFKKSEGGKRQSSNNFADPAKWKRVTELLQIAAGLYQNLQ
ncbi:hypothetical protein PGT21_009942 [Puccinia graminis f. sp. tritici]|uniref:Uncharacterized protein n=1 Tax=Puccinia graminis f. sp. tritici TaxID=56615 RepID=A0A5B0P471_PUCGR|nr:hypothetical protein PGT21_009942 [Puccinia graminis f. sp. tritici]